MLLFSFLPFWARIEHPGKQRKKIWILLLVLQQFKRLHCSQGHGCYASEEKHLLRCPPNPFLSSWDTVSPLLSHRSRYVVFPEEACTDNDYLPYLVYTGPSVLKWDVSAHELASSILNWNGTAYYTCIFLKEADFDQIINIEAKLWRVFPERGKSCGVFLLSINMWG